MKEASARFEELIRKVLPRDPSDLFLIPGEPPAIRVPPAFLIERLDTVPLSAEDVRELAVEIVGDDALHALGGTQSRIRRRYGVPGEFCLTVNVARSLGTATITCRFMQPRVPTIQEVMLPEAMVQASDAPNGLVLFSGPMGSGKTTSMFALLDHINATKAVHICTVEDPVAVLLPARQALVQQREVGDDVPTVLAGIQASLSQDLDVLMVGDLKSVDELEGCFAAAETGHLVFTQVHEDSPAGAIHRVLDVYPEDMRERARHRLATKLRAVCSQRLLPCANGKGRVAVYSVLIPDEEMCGTLARGDDFMARKTPWPQGCQTIHEHVHALVEAGVISREDADALLGSIPV